jgi:hypothetical protein
MQTADRHGVRPGRQPESDKLITTLLLIGMAFFTFGRESLAGPPFQTDDPEPVPLHHHEFYAFSTLDRASDGSTAQIPAFEFNLGAAPDLQLHIVGPLALLVPRQGPTEYGAGDVELGVKYRFLKETRTRPQLGTFPMLELPTGDAARGLGNGVVWARLPVWIQKSIGSWTTYGGAGYEINRAAGMQDSEFAGWLLQRELGRKLILGGELYAQTAQASGGRSTTFFDAGGYYNFTPGFQLLFMAGHTVAGERHTVGYLGLYWTW